MDLNNYKRDEAKEEGGVWIQLDDRSKILIARAFTKRYSELFRRETKGMRYMLQTGNVDEEMSRKVMAKVISETVLLDWEGLELNGEKIPYSKEKAFEILSDPVYKDFLSLVDDLSRDASNFRAEALDAAAGN